MGEWSRIKKVFKSLGLVTLLLVLIFMGWYFAELTYAVRQLYGQVSIISKSVDVEECLKDVQFKDEYKRKLHYISDVKKFAQDSLGLTTTDSYSTFFDQNGEDILWNVTASEKYQLESYQWEFPIAGSFSYKGFFDYGRAQLEFKARLEDGLDVSLSPVGAWSTLGVFKDPILSNMLERSEGDLAELIIHEMTHATVYIKDDVGFNENLATFIGEKGVEIFLRGYNKSNPLWLEAYLRRKSQKREWINFVIEYAEKLDHIYIDVQDQEVEVKEKVKSNFMSVFVLEGNKKRAELDLPVYSIRDTLINNTYFLSYLRYHGGQDGLDSLYEFRFNGDFRSMLSYYQNQE